MSVVGVCLIPIMAIVSVPVDSMVFLNSCVCHCPVGGNWGRWTPIGPSILVIINIHVNLQSAFLSSTFLLFESELASFCLHLAVLLYLSGLNKMEGLLTKNNWLRFPPKPKKAKPTIVGGDLFWILTPKFWYNHSLYNICKCDSVVLTSNKASYPEPLY